MAKFEYYNQMLDALEAGGLACDAWRGVLFDELPKEQQKALVLLAYRINGSRLGVEVIA